VNDFISHFTHCLHERDSVCIGLEINPEPIRVFAPKLIKLTPSPPYRFLSSLKDSADLAIFRKAWVKRDVSATSAMFLRNCS